MKPPSSVYVIVYELSVYMVRIERSSVGALSPPTADAAPPTAAAASGGLLCSRKKTRDGGKYDEIRDRRALTPQRAL
jgi:hypothetical protein